ncbi:hypothetical protein FVB32_13325 [Flagellimonas hymeniacidonis]|uniref:N-acetyltransferase domain-containing protein n=1 Tax=Flagellimonas hymeniacidonis TaxID=2603628 RepID=A0A5C8V3M2_9FLAO|nr:GNAT family N-acetyltransferase [Flagellimonas hymeniacidonis]TXN35555.1 hypothetical protein FVB32_13325 [Flagellimonas hymeniacidonis]
MRAKEGSKFYKFRLFFIRIKHGLFLMTLRNFLTRIGLDIGAYYWVKEGVNIYIEPVIKGNKEDFEIGFLTLSDIKKLKNISFVNTETLIERFDNGLKCIGLKHSGDITAFMSIEYNGFNYRKKQFKLELNEAYLLNMYTYQSYRGKNLAPYLRYHSYQLLKKEGVENIYSITDYFNKSSQKFKEKLNARPLTLYFAILLFKKYHRTIKIKDYSN